MYTYTNAKNQTFNLFSRKIELKSGQKPTIYYFARTDYEGDKSNALEAVPDGYEVYETDRTKMPILRKIK